MGNIGQVAMDAIEAILAAFCALLFATLAEYFIHRAMHWGIIYPDGHRWHHESNESRTFLLDVFVRDFHDLAEFHERRHRRIFVLTQLVTKIAQFSIR